MRAEIAIFVEKCEFGAHSEAIAALFALKWRAIPMPLIKYPAIARIAQIYQKSIAAAVAFAGVVLICICCKRAGASK